MAVGHIQVTTADNVTCYINPARFANYSTGKFIFSATDSNLAAVFSACFAVLGFTFNLITVLALLNHRRTRVQVTTPFVISLAVSDCLFSAVILPQLSLRFFAKDWILGTTDGFMCRLFPLLFYGSTATTLFNILTVTVNRWVMVYFPHKVEAIFSRKNSKIYIGFCWITPVILMLPSLLGFWGFHGLECVSRSCTIIKDDEGKSIKGLLLTIGVTLPCIILIFTNVSIYVKVKMMRRNLEATISSSRLPAGLKKREQRLTKMMFIIFSCFVFTYLPSFLVKKFDPFKKYPTTHIACYIVNWASVVMNPMIYVATQEKYRFAMVLLWQRIRYLGNPERVSAKAFALEARRQSHMNSQGGNRSSVMDTTKKSPV